MSSRILGLDIRNHTVNGVIVRSGFKIEKIETHFEVPLSGQGEFALQLSEAFDQIVGRIDTRDLFCQVAIPAEWMIYRNVNIPIKGKSKIRQVLPYEMEPLIAQPVELFTFDFLPLMVGDIDNSDYILAAGVERDRLNTCLDLLTKTKMDPDLITAGSFALAGCLPKFIDIADKTALVSVDDGITSVFLLLSGQIAMVRSFRLSSGLNSMAAFINVNLNQTISAFEEQFNTDFDLQSVYLNQAGTGENDDIDLALEENCGCAVRSFNLFDAAELSMPSSPDTQPIGQLNNALALILARTKGLKILDFRRGGFGKQLFLTEQRAPLIKTAVLLGVLLLFSIFGIVLDGYYTKKTLYQLNEQVAGIFKETFPEVRRIVDPLQQMKVKIREEKDRIKQLGVTDRKVAVIDVLNDISRLIPEKLDVTFTDVTIGPENMTLSGHADNFEMVNDMRSDLEKAGWVATAIISSANRNKTGQRVDFKIRLVFDNRLNSQDT